MLINVLYSIPFYQGHKRDNFFRSVKSRPVFTCRSCSSHLLSQNEGQVHFVSISHLGLVLVALAVGYTGLRTPEYNQNYKFGGIFVFCFLVLEC